MIYSLFTGHFSDLTGWDIISHEKSWSLLYLAGRKWKRVIHYYIIFIYSKL